MNEVAYCCDRCKHKVYLPTKASYDQRKCRNCGAHYQLVPADYDDLPAAKGKGVFKSVVITAIITGIAISIYYASNLTPSETRLASKFNQSVAPKMDRNVILPKDAWTLLPAPPIKAGWGQDAMDKLVNELFEGSYERALNAARQVSQQVVLNEGHNTAANIIREALAQPLIEGKVGSEGCIAHFNEDGEVISAISTKFLDFRTGAVSVPQPYTPEELVAATPALKEYRHQSNSDNFVLLFSKSFRDAAIIATLTGIEDVVFAVQRQKYGAAIVMTVQGKKGTLADDWIYY